MIDISMTRPKLFIDQAMTQSTTQPFLMHNRIKNSVQTKRHCASLKSRSSVLIKKINMK